MAAPKLDLGKLIAAARKLPQQELGWWASAYEEASDRVALATSLDRWSAAPPKSLDKLIDDSYPPWHLAMLARVAEAKAKVTATLGARPAFVAGSLHVKGPLQLKGALVVTGDLTVDGAIVDVLEKWRLLVVGGNLKAHSIATRQALLVGGDCTVRDLVWADEMHCPLVVRGALKTPLLVVTDHHPLKIGSEAGIGTKLENPYQPALEAYFDKTLLGDCTIKTKAMVQRLVAGKPFGP